MAKNQIILNDVVHEFVPDKIKVDMCCKCSIQQVCYDKLNVDDRICNIFTNTEVVNGHFEEKK